MFVDSRPFIHITYPVERTSEDYVIIPCRPTDPEYQVSLEINGKVS